MAAVGYSGTMVAAVLETAGYYYQSQILDQLGSAFTGSLGGFIYAIGVVTTVFAVAVRGGYRFGPWLLIGPPLFFSMVIPRTQADNALWQFAGQDRFQNKVDDEVARLVPPGGAEVSTLFAKYDRLVSRTVQEFVKVINRDKPETDKWFIFKGQLLSRIYSRNADNPGLQQLIQHGLLYQCGEVVQAASDILNPGEDRNAVDAATGQTVLAMRVAALKNFNTPSITLNPTAASFVAQMNKEYPDRFGGEPTEVNQIVGGKDNKQRAYSCKQIWDYVLVGLVREGVRAAQEVSDTAGRHGLDVGEVLTALSKALGQTPDGASPGGADQAELIQKIALAAAKYTLRNESAHRSFSGMMEEQAQRSIEAGTVEIPAQNEMAQTELSRGRSTEYAERTRMLTIGTSLPYYQGLVLFLLAVAFPFFALLLLVPGKHAGFLLWFALWLWVKSWDIGMAIVMQLDDIIFSMLNLSKEFRTSPIQREQLDLDFATAIAALRLTDPTFQLATYYNIIGACLMAIPIVSSQLIMGSLSGGAGVISQGMKVTTEDYGEGSRKAHSQLAVSNLRHDILQLGVDKATSYFANAGGFEDKTLPDGRLTKEGGLKRQMSSFYAGQSVTYGPTERAPDGRVTYETNRRMDNNPRSVERSVATAQLSKVVEGLSSALTNPAGFSRALGRAPSEPGTQKVFGVLAALGGASQASAAAVGKYFQGEAEGQMDPMGKWAAWDAVYSERGRRLAAESRIWGQLEVPQTANSPELDEVKLDTKMLQMQADLEAEIFRAAGKATSGTITSLVD